jgi:uncharacterized protein DUF2851
MPVPKHATNFYPRKPAGETSARALRESEEPTPSEHLLQAVWQQQRLLRDQLRTLDGKTVRVLHPGFKNHEAGPDFRGAMIQIDGAAPTAGDVEVDLQANGWRAHGHDVNPAFKKVVLHVIWEGERPVADGLPVLVLRGRLDAPLAELRSSLERDSLRSLPEDMQGQCCAPLRSLPQDSLTDLLHQAARVRFEVKSAQILARTRHVGWEQALWEGLFRALGYKQNAWPMQNLAESRAHWFSASGTVAECQARLLGISGLLPAELPRGQTGANKYLRGIWDQWWREREQFAEFILPRSVWRFNSLRPANHPQRRLALAAHWLASGDLISRLEDWFTSEQPDRQLADSLLKVLQVGRDDFWSWHFTFRSARLAKPQPMLGAGRATDLAVNVILPWFWIRATEGKNEKLRQVAEHRFFAWPCAEDNAPLKLARQRLLGGAKANVLRGAAAQQGLLQILRDYCEHSNAICQDCKFPELVRNWATPG